MHPILGKIMNNEESYNKNTEVGLYSLMFYYFPYDVNVRG